MLQAAEGTDAEAGCFLSLWPLFSFEREGDITVACSVAAAVASLVSHRVCHVAHSFISTCRAE